MSDWKFLNTHRVGENTPVGSTFVDKRYWSSESDGCNGMFRFVIDGRFVRCIASDGEGWKHVSVTEERSEKCLPWEIMCKVKDLFFRPEDWVIQFHPAHSEYVNNHKGCLHLWMPLDQPFPKPDSLLVGIKGSAIRIL